MTNRIELSRDEAEELVDAALDRLFRTGDSNHHLRMGLQGLVVGFGMVKCEEDFDEWLRKQLDD